jgi:flagellar assembly protein FliH
LADATKDSSLPEAEACGRYCFPEISGVAEADPVWTPAKAHFVDGASDPTDGGAGPEGEAHPADPVAERIEAAYRDGLEKGRAEATACLRQEVGQASTALASAVDELFRVREQDLARMEAETVRLALAIAKKIVGIEAAKGEAVCRVVRAAMEKVGDPRGLTLKLNPQDVDAVRRCTPASLLGDAVDTPFRIEADDGIVRGGCMIETRLGDVDARIDQQIGIVEEQLIDALGGSRSDGSDR